MITWIQAMACACGLGVSALLLFFPRFGTGSWKLLLLTLPVSLSAAIQAFGSSFFEMPAADSVRLSLALILFASAGGCVAASSLNGQAKRQLTFPVFAVSIVLILLLWAIPPSLRAVQLQPGYVALGPAGYCAALYLLVVGIIVLAHLEQVVRSAPETVRWELKFLYIGIAVFYAAVIYASSQILLFSPLAGLVAAGTVGLLHSIFVVSCGLAVLAWKRGSGRTRIVVSHGAIYSSITLLSVGVYLVASSLIARWISRWGNIGLPLEALIFLLSAVGLTVLILGTGFRHRARAWIRRNIFAGRYDYRQFWLETTERVRSIDPPHVTAQALADIVRRALGAIDISVWVRLWDPNRLKLLHAAGTISEALEKEAPGVVEQFLDISEPLSIETSENRETTGLLASFAMATKASLLVPLISSNRIVGVITVGADRSGRPYDWEAREFLRVLAGHAAGEFHKSDLLSTLVEAKEDEAFRSFSTFVLHDLKNFASTLSYIAQNAPKHKNNPEFQKDAFQSVYDTAEKMKRLCNSLRTFSSNPAPNKKLTNLNQIARSTADNLVAGISGRLTLDLGDIPGITADADELGRVLQNLLVNALEAIPEDGSIIVRTRRQGESVELSVVDNGKGMSREFRDKELFQPFHTTKSAGLGIGLFQSKKIVEAHRGTIQIESEEGAGTSVTVRLPLDQEERIPMQSAQSQPQ